VAEVDSVRRHSHSYVHHTGPQQSQPPEAVPQISSQSLYLSSTVQTSNAGPIVTQVLLARVGSYVIGLNTSTGTSAPISQSTVVQFGSWLAGLVRAG
jgi:hypothetical protein